MDRASPRSSPTGACARGQLLSVEDDLATNRAHRTGTVVREAPRWAARNPRCRYELVPGAGHNANQDQPEAVNRLVLELLAEHAPPPAPPEES